MSHVHADALGQCTSFAKGPSMHWTLKSSVKLVHEGERIRARNPKR
jgi:hypothetical protein